MLLIPEMISARANNVPIAKIASNGQEIMVAPKIIKKMPVIPQIIFPNVDITTSNFFVVFFNILLIMKKAKFIVYFF